MLALLLSHVEVEPGAKAKVHKYLELIERRATGEAPTAAAWMRAFVAAHPDYHQDSVVPASVAFDLLDRCAKVGDGRVSAPDLLGRGVTIKPVVAAAAYDVPLDSARIAGGVPQAPDLIEAYTQRRSHRAIVTEADEDPKEGATEIEAQYAEGIIY
jgi:glutamate--cysteine ligase catalytic subunit